MDNKKVKIYIISLIILIFNTNMEIFSQKIKEISLSDIGFQKDIVLYGITPTQFFYFPIPIGNIDFKNSYFELQAGFSSILNEYSNIKISINDVPVYTSFFKNVSTNPIIRIPLSDVKLEDLMMLEKPLLKIEVGGYLSITDDRCRDLATQGLWMVIRQNSKVVLSYSSDIEKFTIADFFSEKINSLLILTPKRINPQIAGSVTWINSRLLDLTKSENIIFNSFEEYDMNITSNYSHILIVGKTEDLMSLPIPLSLNRNDIAKQY